MLRSEEGAMMACFPFALLAKVAQKGTHQVPDMDACKGATKLRQLDKSKSKGRRYRPDGQGQAQIMIL